MPRSSIPRCQRAKALVSESEACDQERIGPWAKKSVIIDPMRCTECVGHYDTPQCVEVCPVECIIVDPAHAETPAQLLAKFDSLREEKK